MEDRVRRLEQALAYERHRAFWPVREIAHHHRGVREAVADERARARCDERIDENLDAELPGISALLVMDPGVVARAFTLGDDDLVAVPRAVVREHARVVGHQEDLVRGMGRQMRVDVFVVFVIDVGEVLVIYRMDRRSVIILNLIKAKYRRLILS